MALDKCVFVLRQPELLIKSGQEPRAFFFCELSLRY